MYAKTIIQESIVCCVLAIAVLMPTSHDVNATPSQTELAKYQAYPSPSVKPLSCKSNPEIDSDSHISKKQAAVAALGLYLGLKQATGTQDVTEENRNLCA